MIEQKKTTLADFLHEGTLPEGSRQPTEEERAQMASELAERGYEVMEPDEDAADLEDCENPHSRYPTLPAADAKAKGNELFKEGK